MMTLFTVVLDVLVREYPTKLNDNDESMVNGLFID